MCNILLGPGRFLTFAGRISVPRILRRAAAFARVCSFASHARSSSADRKLRGRSMPREGDLPMCRSVQMHAVLIIALYQIPLAQPSCLLRERLPAF